jgi:hypothetical protein
MSITDLTGMTATLKICKQLIEEISVTCKGGVTRATKLLQLATKSDFNACELKMFTNHKATCVNIST